MEYTLVEAVKIDGEAVPSSWRVRLIDAGTSKNMNRYSLGVLHEAVARFEGVRAMARTDEDHLQGKGKSAKNIVGWFTGAKPSDVGIDATFNISEAAPWLKTLISDAWNRGKKDIVGLSMVARTQYGYARTAEGMVRDVKKIIAVDFVDVVVDPSAGSAVLGLAEATDPDGRNTIMLDKLLEMIKKSSPDEFAKIDQSNISEAVVLAALERISEAKTADPPAPAPAAAPPASTEIGTITEAIDSLKAFMTEAKVNTDKVAAEFQETLARDRVETTATAMLAESVLPKTAHGRILSSVRATDKPATKEQIAEMIEAERKYLGLGGKWTGPGSTAPRAEITLDFMDKWHAGLGALVAGEPSMAVSEADGAEKIPAYRSIKQAYGDLTGDYEVTGQVANAPFVGTSSEAAITSSTWAGALGDHLRKVMQKDYRQAPYDQWKLIANIGSPVDFRTNYRPQLGGFSALATVTEGGAYAAFTTEPDDFTPNYAVTKHGNIQVISLETIANDDVGAVQRMPRKIGRAAARTLNAAVWAPILTNAAYSDASDTDTIFHANHGGNLGSSALSMAQIIAGRQVMMKQAEPQSTERLNIGPKYLMVPVDLEQAAVELVFSAGQPVLDRSVSSVEDAESRPNFLRRLGLDVIVIPHATDANNWYMAADKMDLDIMEVGFLGGRQEPELFLQDMQNVGSMFTNDQITYKVRHIYGVCALDWRGLYGSVVA